MTDTLANTPSPEDIDDDTGPSAALERQADAILARDAERRPVTSVRQAVREDAALGREWIEGRVAQARRAAREEPIRAIVYASVAGVLLGLLLNR